MPGRVNNVVEALALEFSFYLVMDSKPQQPLLVAVPQAPSSSDKTHQTPAAVYLYRESNVQEVFLLRRIDIVAS
jgi:hypothetical protein